MFARTVLCSDPAAVTKKSIPGGKENDVNENPTILYLKTRTEMAKSILPGVGCLLTIVADLRFVVYLRAGWRTVPNAPAK